MAMTKKERREMDRLRALVAEADKARDKSWDAYKEMLYRAVNAEQTIKNICEIIDEWRERNRETP